MALFEKILIANRGEIACRVMRTAAKLGIATVAVYSEADRAARHVRLADEALCIGPAPARESYLKIEAIIQAAKASGAKAIHPGYGFLSENAGFAEACEKAGLVFIGPPPSAIRAMGSKSEAKALMEKAGVPLVLGYHGKEQGDELLLKEAKRIGFPVLLKASAGGGGKGMRVVEKESDFADQLAGARREAANAFGDERMLIERYLKKPRHIEMQVFADGRGNCLYLFERDCSLQRRHQKVIEEAPAPGMSEERRRKMGQAAVDAAKAIGYRGAGTVEFIAEDGAFYFMEMNTRLQVEHPVTEMITGLDLVEWQLRVAAGEALPLKQDQLSIKGHAVEARLYAEDPARDFLPQIGRLAHLSFPPEGAHVRIDTGVSQGDEISVHYDPMIAKVIAWDHDRTSALARLAGALDATCVAGCVTNAAFLARLARHPDFIAGDVDTGLIAREKATLVPEQGAASAEDLAFAALSVLAAQSAKSKATGEKSNDPSSPWALSNGWRLNMGTRLALTFLEGETAHLVEVRFEGDDYLLKLPSGDLRARLEAVEGPELSVSLNGHRRKARVVAVAGELWIFGPQGLRRLALKDPHAAGDQDAAVGGRLTAPMPGKVAAIAVAAGAKVARGQVLLILEAMKMEHAIAAPANGEVTALNFAVGDLVEEGAELLAFTAAGEA